MLERCANCLPSVEITNGRLKRQLFGRIIDRRDFTIEEALLGVFGEEFTAR